MYEIYFDAITVWLIMGLKTFVTWVPYNKSMFIVSYLNFILLHYFHHNLSDFSCLFTFIYNPLY